MKTQKRGDARGRASWRSSFLGDPDALFLPSRALFCSDPERGQGAPLFGRGVSAPLTARTAAKESAREEKTSLSNGGRCCTTRTSRPPSWIASCSVDGSFTWMGPQGEHII